MDHIWSELSTMTRPSWVALHGMAHSFIELDKDVVYVIRSTWPASWEICMQVRKQQLELDMEQQTGSK